MKTLILQDKDNYPMKTIDKLIVSELKFYDKHSEKYTLVICYYE